MYHLGYNETKVSTMKLYDLKLLSLIITITILLLLLFIFIIITFYERLLLVYLATKLKLFYSRNICQQQLMYVILN